jgi:hypothetical protein
MSRNGPEFWETVRGARFYDGQVPRLVKALEIIAERLPATPPNHADALAATLRTLLPLAEAGATEIWKTADETRGIAADTAIANARAVLRAAEEGRTT